MKFLKVSIILLQINNIFLLILSIGYTQKPVVGFYVIEKSHTKKDKNGNEAVIYQKNHEASSKQIEHAVLIGILEMVVLILKESDMLLDIIV